MLSQHHSLARLLVAAIVLAMIAGALSPAVAQTVLFSEDFNGVSLGPAVDEATVLLEFWGDTPPPGWSINNDAMPAGGTTEWSGWSFAVPSIWSDVAGDQDRSDFTKGQGVVAVADPDEWDDIAHDPGLFNSFLKTPEIAVSGSPVNALTLRFDSSWVPECCDDFMGGLNNQTAVINAEFDVGGSTEVLRWESDAATPFFKDKATNETVFVDLVIPSGASTLTLDFGMIDAGNDWWWAIDNIGLFAGDPALSMELNRDTGEASLINRTNSPLEIKGYSLRSIDGALDPSDFTPLAQSDPNWVRLSADDTPFIVSEGHLTSETIADGEELSLGTAWSQHFREQDDLTFTYLDGNGDLVDGVLRFTGNGGDRFLIGDLNFDGSLDELDWPLYRDNFDADLSGLTLYDAYQRGDLTLDGANNIADFLTFKAAFELANGAGSFAAMLAGVPEPSTASLVLVMLATLPSLRRGPRQGMQSSR